MLWTTTVDGNRKCHAPANRLRSRRVFCADGREFLGDGDTNFDLSQLRLHLWSTPNQASSSRAAGTTASSPTAGEAAENQLMYVVLGTVLGVVVLAVVVCVVMCTWRHQQQPRRAVGTSLAYLLTYRRRLIVRRQCR